MSKTVGDKRRTKERRAGAFYTKSGFARLQKSGRKAGRKANEELRSFGKRKIVQMMADPGVPAKWKARTEGLSIPDKWRLTDEAIEAEFKRLPAEGDVEYRRNGVGELLVVNLAKDDAKRLAAMGRTPRRCVVSHALLAVCGKGAGSARKGV